jgi:hypothetical protein
MVQKSSEAKTPAFGKPACRQGKEKEINAAADKLTKTTNESFFGRLFPSKTYKLTYQAPEHFLNVPNAGVLKFQSSLIF